MEKQGRTYPIPTRTLPFLKNSDNVGDLVKIRNFIEDRGIKTKNTRIDRYIQYLSEIGDGKPIDGSHIFKNSTDSLCKHNSDWFLYVLRETHELMWILKGLKAHIPTGLDKKLELIVSGRDFAAIDINCLSRNTQFELRIASYFCQSGCNVDLSRGTDIIAETKKFIYFIECKRISSTKSLKKRLTDARKQLLKRMPRTFKRKAVYGFIAADVTKVAYDHNGLTWALTNDHSRDLIQEKLRSISNNSRSIPSLANYNKILGYWFKIHIPAILMLPNTSGTRFSSYLLYRSPKNRTMGKALKEFNAITSVGNKPDSREIPSQKIKLRDHLTIPSGSIITLDEKLFDEFLIDGNITTRDPKTIVATLDMNGKKYEFNFTLFEMLFHHMTEAERKSFAEKNARPDLVAELYILKYPYGEPHIGSINY